MTPVFDESQIHTWLSNLYGECRGLINIVSTGNWAGQTFRTVDQAARYIKLLELRQPQGIYARATTMKTAPEKGRGGVDQTQEFVGFWADLDIAGPGHKWHLCPDTGHCPDADKPSHRENHTPLIPDIDACLELISVTGLPQPTEWISSGGGMYPWWLLHQPSQYIPRDSGIDSLIEVSAQWQRVIELAANKLGYHYGAGVGDLSRVLRIPGTVNRKVADAPTMCEWRLDLSNSTPYDLGDLIDVMDTAAKRLEKPRPVSVPSLPAPSAHQQGTRPGDAYNAATNWISLLEADGATIFRDSGTGYIEWTRPDKDRRHGMSATTGYSGGDVLKVFTDAWHPLRQDATYDRFGYYATTHHNGDIKAATRALSALGYGEKRAPVPSPDEWNYRPPLEEEPSPQPEQQPRRNWGYNDSGFASRFEDIHGENWRYAATRKQWLRWDGTCWVPDVTGAVTDLIDKMVQHEDIRADDIEDEKERAKKKASIKPMLSNSKQLGATAILARRGKIAITVDQLDAQKTKLTCANGVLDLNDFAFSGHQREHLATKKLRVAYDPAATAPKWEKFLVDILPDPAMREYLQRAAGYTLTGDANRKAIFMLHGPSHTGKSQLINALTEIFGDFAQGAKEQTFRVSESANGPTPGLHKLRGARLVTASESTEGVKLDESLIKRLTGGDEIQSRALYQDEESWTPEFAIWLATNHLPKFNSDDAAIWRRVKPIAFNVVFGTDDHPEVYDMGRTLAREEGPGILNWIIEGIRRYRETGLEEPQQLRDGVTDYRNDSDPVAQFINHAISEGGLVAEDDAKIDTKTLYVAFTHWCAEEGIRYPLASSRFGRRMATLGYVSTRTAVSRQWLGLRRGEGTWIISQERLLT